MMTAADTLARTLWGEARGEGEQGMAAVACVILNRAAKPGWWGRTIEQVCRRKWQFSCWNASDPNLPKLLAVDESDPAFKTAVTIALDALGGRLEDITSGATHYYFSRMKYPPRWAAGRTPCAIIGRHFFFKDV